MMTKGYPVAYVDVFDLLFNGGEGCELRKDRPESPFIIITKEYDRGRGSHVYRYYYNGVYLGGESNVTIGGLEEAVNALRGKGVFQYMDAHGIYYKPLTKTEENIVRKLGLWAF